MSRHRVSLIVNSLSHVTGLSRYAQMLHQELNQLDDFQSKLIPISEPPLSSLLRFSRAFGLDINAFLRTYPMTPTSHDGQVAHLTFRSHASQLRRPQQVPVVVTAHDIIHFQHRNDETMHIYRHRLQAWADALSIRRLRQAHAVIASSEHTRKALVEVAQVSPDRVHRIYLGVDTQQFKSTEVPATFLDHHNLDKERRYILHVSTEEPRKNLPALVQAFASVSKQHPDAVLLKVGRPLYSAARSALLRQISELNLHGKVVLVDAVSEDDLVNFYNLAQMLVMPSLAEGFGFPVLEAMACGTAVICSDVTSLPEIAGDAALLVHPQRPEQIADAVCQLLNDDGLRDSLAVRGQERAREFTWERTAQETAQIYRLVLEEQHA